MEITRKNKNKNKIIFYFKKIFTFSLKSFLLLSVSISLFVGYYIYKTTRTLPVITETLLNESVGQTSNMYSSDGTIIWSDTERRRDFIPIEQIPQKYIDFVLGTEDNNFYDNRLGFDPKGILSALMSLGKRGGSGINQQLIKNIVFSSENKDRNIDRKIKELWLSIQMEKNFSKNKILEYYINLINMGEGSYGANTIAITYYGTSLKDMTGTDPNTLSKLAIIAGLGQAPSYYNLYDNPNAIEERREEVLLANLHNKRITEEEYNAIKSIPVTEGLMPRYWRNEEVLNQVREHSPYILSALNQIQELGYDLTKTPMQIYTGLDRQTNSDIKNMFDNFWYYQDENMQSAGTFMDPNTGLVLAQYGGRYMEPFGYNRATQTNRSSGSSTKPFISYGPAIEFFGHGSGTMYDSSNYVYPGTNFVAQNYGGAVYGNVSMTRALKLSLNTPAIRVLDTVVGSKLTKQFLNKINLDVQESYGGQDALGINISTEQLAGAFSTLSNLGNYKKPQYITKIVFNDNSEKQVVFNPIKAMNESTAYILLRILEEVPTSMGTATKAILPYEGYAVKTGTVGYDASYGFGGTTASDVWIGGTTKSVSGAIWMGYDKPYELGGQVYDTLHTQQYLFRQAMEYFNNGKDTSQWNKPNTVSGNSTNNFIPNDWGRTISSYTIPDVSNINTTNNINEISKLLSTNVSDLGMEKYKDPENYNDIINWRNTVNQEELTRYNNYSGDPLQAVLRENNIFYKLER